MQRLFIICVDIPFNQSISKHEENRTKYMQLSVIWDMSAYSEKSFVVRRDTSFIVFDHVAHVRFIGD